MVLLIFNAFYDLHPFKIQSMLFTAFSMYLAYAQVDENVIWRRLPILKEFYIILWELFLELFPAACLSVVSKCFINKHEWWLLLVFHPRTDSHCVPQWLYWSDFIWLFWILLVVLNCFAKDPWFRSNNFYLCQYLGLKFMHFLLLL